MENRSVAGLPTKCYTTFRIFGLRACWMQVAHSPTIPAWKRSAGGLQRGCASGVHGLTLLDTNTLIHYLKVWNPSSPGFKGFSAGSGHSQCGCLRD